MSGQPPPNFNPTDSVLQVSPAASHVPIEPVQGGGGMIGGNTDYTDADLQTLKEYGLADGGILTRQFDEKTKHAFLDQMNKCIVEGSGTQTITDSGCWAIAQVLRALVEQQIRKTNSVSKIENMSVKAAARQTNSENKENEENIKSENKKNTIAENQNENIKSINEQNTIPENEENTNYSENLFSNNKNIANTAAQIVSLEANKPSNKSSRGGKRTLIQKHKKPSGAVVTPKKSWFRRVGDKSRRASRKGNKTRKNRK